MLDYIVNSPLNEAEEQFSASDTYIDSNGEPETHHYYRQLSDLLTTTYPTFEALHEALLNAAEAIGFAISKL